MEVVNRWRASNLERGAIEDVLADDVEWVVPKCGGVTTLRGDRRCSRLGRGRRGCSTKARGIEETPESLDVSEERGRARGSRRRPSRLAQPLDLYVEGIGRIRVRADWPARLHRGRREDGPLRARGPARRERSVGRSRPVTSGMGETGCYFCAGDQTDQRSCEPRVRVRFRCPLPSAFMT